MWIKFRVYFRKLVTVNGLKDILKFWFNNNLNYKFRLILKDRY